MTTYVDMKGFIMKISIKQFADNNLWSNDFQLHFIINNLDTKKATYHAGTRTTKHGILYEHERYSSYIEPFKFIGEIE